MKYHVILNGCFKEFEKQAREINGFIQNQDLEYEPGNTIIICGRERDGDDKQQLAEMAPTKSVIFVIVDHYDPEKVMDFLERTAGMKDIYLFGSGYSGVELAVRLGKRLDGSSIVGAVSLSGQNEQIYVEKMVYSNHMKGRFKMRQAPYCISIAKGQDEAECRLKGPVNIQEWDICGSSSEDEVLHWQYEETDGGSSLEESPFVVVAGRGVRKQETAAQIEQAASRMGAAFGASRPAVMNAWVPMEQMVGVSGAMLKPQVCLVTGASGAPALYAGIEKSKLIIAVNTDERAPIIKKADAAIIGDCREVIEELAVCLEQEEANG